MDLAFIFKIASSMILIPWALMIFVPKWNWTKKISSSLSFSLLFSALYLTCYILFMDTAEGGGFGSLEEVTTLFSYKEIVLVGWIHYLTFDLFVGVWMLSDSQRAGIPHLLIVPCLVFTLMAGPIGLLLYAILRWFYKKDINFFVW